MFIISMQDKEHKISLLMGFIVDTFESILIKVSRALQNMCSTKCVRKMEQGPQGLLMGPKGPTDGAEGCSPPQQVENLSSL